SGSDRPGTRPLPRPETENAGGRSFPGGRPRAAPVLLPLGGFSPGLFATWGVHPAGAGGRPPRAGRGVSPPWAAPGGGGGRTPAHPQGAGGGAGKGGGGLPARRRGEDLIKDGSAPGLELHRGGGAGQAVGLHERLPGEGGPRFAAPLGLGGIGSRGL